MASKIVLPVKIDADELAVSLSGQLSYEALTKLVRDVDKIIADWGFTKKLHDYFVTEMRILAEEEGKSLPKTKEMPKPWTDAEIYRLYSNSQELVGADAANLSRNEFNKLVKHIERCHGIRES